MIPGTGPGRGLPWWRSVLVLRHRYEPGVHQVMDEPRPGRVVATIRKASST